MRHVTVEIRGQERACKRVEVVRVDWARKAVPPERAEEPCTHTWVWETQLSIDDGAFGEANGTRILIHLIHIRKEELIITIGRWSPQNQRV